MARHTFDADSLHNELRHAEHIAAKASQSAELSGDHDPREPYTNLLHDLNTAQAHINASRARVLKLRDHAHTWGSDDRCTLCGADGRV